MSIWSISMTAKRSRKYCGHCTGDGTLEHKKDPKFILKMNSKDWLLFEVFMCEIFFWLRHIFCLGDGFLNICGRLPSSKCLLTTLLLRNIWFEQNHTKYCLFTSSLVSQSQYEQMRGQRNGGKYELKQLKLKCLEINLLGRRCAPIKKIFQILELQIRIILMNSFSNYISGQFYALMYQAHGW